jgi:hypothetical protein
MTTTHSQWNVAVILEWSVCHTYGPETVRRWRRSLARPRLLPEPIERHHPMNKSQLASTGLPRIPNTAWLRKIVAMPEIRVNPGQTLTRVPIFSVRRTCLSSIRDQVISGFFDPLNC